MHSLYLFTMKNGIANCIFNGSADWRQYNNSNCPFLQYSLLQRSRNNLYSGRKTLGGRTPEELPAARKINMQSWEVSIHSSHRHSTRYGSGKEAEANSQQLLQSPLWHFSNHPKRVCNHFCHNGFWFTSEVTHTLWLVEGKGKKRKEHYSHYPKITAGRRWMVQDYYPLVLISQQRVLLTWFITEFGNIFNYCS